MLLLFKGALLLFSLVASLLEGAAVAEGAAIAFADATEGPDPETFSLLEPRLYPLHVVQFCWLLALGVECARFV